MAVQLGYVGYVVISELRAFAATELSSASPPASTQPSARRRTPHRTNVAPLVRRAWQGRAGLGGQVVADTCLLAGWLAGWLAGFPPEILFSAPRRRVLGPDPK